LTLTIGMYVCLSAGLFEKGAILANLTDLWQICLNHVNFRGLNASTRN